jgi:hypothetical protein
MQLTGQHCQSLPISFGSAVSRKAERIPRDPQDGRNWPIALRQITGQWHRRFNVSFEIEIASLFNEKIVTGPEVSKSKHRGNPSPYRCLLKAMLGSGVFDRLAAFLRSGARSATRSSLEYA